MNNLPDDNNTNQYPYGGNPNEGTLYGGNPPPVPNAPAQNGSAKKGMGKGLKTVITIVIVLWVLGLGVFGFFMFRVFKLVSTPREALSASEFTEAVEELGYESFEAPDILMEEYLDYHGYMGNNGRTRMVFAEFDSKRDAQGYYEELLDFYNAESSSSSTLVNGVNYMIRKWSKVGVYYYAEIVDGTVVFVTTEDKEELAEIMEALQP